MFKVSNNTQSSSLTDALGEIRSCSAIFVSGFAPSNSEMLSTGIGQRFLMMLEALCRNWQNVTVILLAADVRTYSDAEITKVKNTISSAIRYPVDIKLLVVRPRSKNFPSPVAKLMEYFAPASPVFTLSRGSLRDLRQLIDAINPSAIFAHRLPAFRALRMAGLKLNLPIVLDLDDIEHIAQFRSVMSAPHYKSKKIMLWHCLVLAREEIIAARVCRKVIVCSDLDVSKMKKLYPSQNYHVIANSLAKPSVISQKLKMTKSRNVIFVGAMGYMPNRVGMEWFMREVWPRVVMRCPDARLLIAGKNGDDLKIPESHRDSIKALGFVSSLANLYREAAVSICPIFSGGGTRIKIIESTAHEVPVVSTTIGAEGLCFADNESILIRNSARDFASAIVEVMLNDRLSAKIAGKAKEIFNEKYERNMILEMLTATLKHELKNENYGDFI